jgi:hypothetical protein
MGELELPEPSFGLLAFADTARKLMRANVNKIDRPVSMRVEKLS